MRRRGETTRSLGAAVGVSSAAVTGWTNGSVPRPEMAKKIADHFRVEVEVLLDDAQDIWSLSGGESPHEYLVHEPIAAAAAAAKQTPGDQAARQAAFEDYLKKLRSIREEAERLAGGDITKAIEIFDRMLAAWMAASDKPKH